MNWNYRIAGERQCTSVRKSWHNAVCNKTAEREPAKCYETTNIAVSCRLSIGWNQNKRRMLL